MPAGPELTFHRSSTLAGAPAKVATPPRRRGPASSLGLTFRRSSTFRSSPRTPPRQVNISFYFYMFVFLDVQLFQRRLGDCVSPRYRTHPVSPRYRPDIFPQGLSKGIHPCGEEVSILVFHSRVFPPESHGCPLCASINSCHRLFIS